MAKARQKIVMSFGQELPHSPPLPSIVIVSGTSCRRWHRFTAGLPRLPATSIIAVIHLSNDNHPRPVLCRHP